MYTRRGSAAATISDCSALHFLSILDFGVEEGLNFEGQIDSMPCRKGGP